MSGTDQTGWQPPSEGAAKPAGPGFTRLFWVLLAVLVIGGVLAAIQVSEDANKVDVDTDDLVGPVGGDTVTVTYHVIGSASSADLTLERPDGTEQISVDLPLTSTSGDQGLQIDFASGDFVYISAQNESDLGEVTCIIRASDGGIIAQNTATADYGIATCEGSAR